jgi:hypothetical protein
MAAILDLNTFVMNGEYTIREEGTDYVIQYLIGAPEGATAAPEETAPTPEGTAEALEAAKPVVEPSPEAAKPAGAAPPIAGATQQTRYLPEFFEHQAPGNGCGRHALNNLFHNEYFIRESSTYVINDKTLNSYPILPVPLNTLCTYLLTKYADLLDGCQADENYDINILVAGLDWIGHPTNTNRWVRSSYTLIQPENTDNLLGYIINYGAYHWVALRKLIAPDEEGNNYEYTNSSSYTTTASGERIPSRTLYPSVDAYIAEYGSQIYNVIEVSTYRGTINPLTRLSTLNNDSSVKKSVIDGKKLEVMKARIAKLYYENYQDARLTNLIGRTDVPKSGKSKPNGSKYTYPANTSISEYIYNNLLMNFGTAEEGGKLLDILTDRASQVIPILAKNIPNILNLKREASYLTIFIKQRLTPPLDLDEEEKKLVAAGIIVPSVASGVLGGSRRKTLRLQARQKPGRRALSHKQVHHKENENA